MMLHISLCTAFTLIVDKHLFFNAVKIQFKLINYFKFNSNDKGFQASFRY